MDHSLDTIRDEEIIWEFQRAHSKKCLEALYERHAKDVFRRCLSFKENRFAANVAAIEVWTSVYKDILEFDRGMVFTKILQDTVVVTCVRHLKRDYVFNKLPQHAREPYPERVEVASQVMTSSQITMRLTTVPRDLKILLLLRFGYHYSPREIASLVGYPEFVIKQGIQRARAYVQRNDYLAYGTLGQALMDEHRGVSVPYDQESEVFRRLASHETFQSLLELFFMTPRQVAHGVASQEAKQALKKFSKHEYDLSSYT